MADFRFGSKTACVLALLASACGGTSESSGNGGAGPGIIHGSGGAGANGSSGSPNGSSGSGASGAGSSAGAGNNAGSGNNASDCPVVTPCGGDLLGDWTIKQMCLDFNTEAALSFCPGAKFTISPVTATGTISFKADNTMISAAVVTFSEDLAIPTSCFTQAQCTDYASLLSAEATITSSHCDYDAVSGCTCSVTSTQPTMANSTYQVLGSNVSITASDTGKTVVDTFCVSGSTLSLYAPNGSGSSGTVILTR